jgi:hypothetical protein
MVRQPRESVPPESELDSAATAEGSAGTRRHFLQLGAFAALGFASGCATTPPGDDDVAGTAGTSTSGGSAGMLNKGGTGGTGVGGTGGTGTGGTGAGTGGTGVGGTGAGTGGTGAGTGGTAGTAAGQGPGGTGNGGTGPGGTGAGGSGVTGGAPPMGGTGPMAGSGPMGGNGGSGGSPPVGGGGKENNGAACNVSGMPPAFGKYTNTKLPNPFQFMNGMTIANKADWACLRNELSLLLQACIYGPKPPKPEMLTATYSSGKVTVNMSQGGKTAMFTFSISGGGSGSSKTPVLITCGGSSLPALQGVAKIDMSNGSFADEMTQGKGLMYDLMGSAATKSGALIGWAWGCSRIIDALELVPEAGIDLKRIAVTGCSRNGKGALAMGAFDERVALTLPQEGGSGGTALWRVSEKEKSLGQNIQESSEIVGEARWQGPDFKQYANGKNTNLPADQHFAVALCAPRAILVIENDIDWLGPVATYGGGKAGSKVFEALGVKDRCGVSVASNHSHCSFPSAQQTFLNNFVNRFLKGMSADTSGVDELHVQSTTSKLGKFDEATWIDWMVPTLAGNLAWDPFA